MLRPGAFHKIGHFIHGISFKKGVDRKLFLSTRQHKLIQLQACNMNNKYLIGALLVLAGCVSHTNDSVTLRWNLSEGEQLRYSVSISEIPTDPHLAVHGIDLLNNSELREQIKHRLVNVKIPAPDFEARLIRHGGLIQASVLAVSPEYDAPPVNEDEAFRRRMLESRAGYIELLGHFSEEGQLQDFFVKQKQRNLLNLFFSMPRLPVTPDSPWELDVTLTEIGPGFYVQSADRVRKAYLEQVDEVDGERIAQILYVIGEDVKGYFKQHVDNEEVPIASRVSHVAYGEFFIDKGQWKNFTMIAYLSGTGLSQNESMTIYALRP